MAERRYRIQKAAELAGLSEELIRAWERRYAVLNPERSDAGYRLYSDEDVYVLRRLKELCDEGLTIREAARLVPELRRELIRVRQAERPPADLSSIERWRGDIIAGAELMEQVRVERALDEALGSLPPLIVFDEVMVPAMREVGDRWHAGRLNVGQEHLVTQAIRQRVVSLLHGAPSGFGRTVVCACFPEEQHELGALGAALRFRHAGLRTIYLGQRTPTETWPELLRALGPAAVALSAVEDPGDAAFEVTLRALRGAIPKDTPLVCGGRAAELHRDLCLGYGFTVFESGGWGQIVSAVTGEARRSSGR